MLGKEIEGETREKTREAEIWRRITRKGKRHTTGKEKRLKKGHKKYQ